jgi:hypothetical protein
MNRYMKERGKFMMQLDQKVIRQLEQRGKLLGVGLQELIRVRVIPEWLYGPAIVSNDTIQRLKKQGLLKNGRSSKLSR